MTDPIVEKLEELHIPIPRPIAEASSQPGAEGLTLLPGETFERTPAEGAQIAGVQGKMTIMGRIRHWLGFAEGGILHDYSREPDTIEVPISEPDYLFGGDVAEEVARYRQGLTTPTVGTNPKDLIGATKPDTTLVPPAATLHEAMAMMDGARKYGPYNWRENPVLMRVYIAAAQRHLAQLLDGEDFDPISGVHHAGHARACLGIILDAIETGNLVDDRPVPGAAGEMIRHFGDFKSFDRVR